VVGGLTGSRGDAKPGGVGGLEPASWWPGGDGGLSDPGAFCCFSGATRFFWRCWRRLALALSATSTTASTLTSPR